MTSGVPRTRRAWGSLTREQVVDVATTIVERGGYPTLTMRSLAAALS